MDGGIRLRGESEISKSSTRIRRIALSPRNCNPIPAVITAIRNADIITLGPGSLYTSLIPNLLVRGIVTEMRRSSALKVFIGNLMTQPGETTSFSAANHLEAIQEHVRDKVFDVIILNQKPISPAQVARYRKQRSLPVDSDHERLRDLGLEIFERDLLSQEKAVRHDPGLLAAAVLAAHARWKAPADNRKFSIAPAATG
jgi:uncharacterized cofD-like protein